ncbi:hypothetical protein L0152_32210 [bacterium]|nr:hypothetical protein [bacterium]
MENIFAVQDDIASSVASALNLTLGKGRTNSVQETQPEAYNAYLQGRYLLDRRTRENLEKALQYFQQTLMIDSQYAPAWLGICEVYILQAIYGYIPQNEGYKMARAEAEKALEINPKLANAYSLIGWIKRVHDWDWEGAKEAYQRALELEPGNTNAIGGSAALASTLGSFDEAMRLARESIALDPLRAASYNNLGFYATQSRQWEDAEKASVKVLEFNPERAGAHSSLGDIKKMKLPLN